MSQTFTIKRGDTSPSLRWELATSETRLNGTTVVFNMKRIYGGALVINRAAAEVVPDVENPTLGYNWTSGDTDVEGLYQAEFEITFADNSVETTPNGGFILVQITNDLG